MTTEPLQLFNWADYTLVGVVLLSAIISLKRGFVREFMTLITWALAFWVAIAFSGELSMLFALHISTPSVRFILSFAILFVSTLVAGGLINYVLSKLVMRNGLGGSDRVLGVSFGVARGVLLIGVLILLGEMTALPSDPWWKQSMLIPHFQGLTDWLHHFLPDKFHSISQYISEVA